MEDKDGGPVGPITFMQGLSLRDFFAGQALAGYLSAMDDVGESARAHPDKAAEWSYEQADAMLKARSQDK